MPAEGAPRGRYNQHVKPDVQASVVRLAGGAIRYLESGAGQPLVCLHAFPLSADEWLPLLSNPPRGFRVIAPDLRGFRGPNSTTPAATGDLTSVTIETYAQDVIALLDYLKIDRAVVAGVSMGGYVALALARLAPARLAGLVLVSTRATADSAEGRAGRDRLIELVTREGPEALAREMLPKLLGETTKREQPEVVDAVRRLIVANTTPGPACRRSRARR
jgi:pimeloyl-ACP methyl ester carboxylesterase